MSRGRWSRSGDAAAGFEVTDDFERFSQRSDVFARSFWDDRIRNEQTERFYATHRRPLADWRNAQGFRQRDYALRNAMWHVADLFAEMREADDRRDGFLDPLSMLRDGADDLVDCGTPAEAAAQLKKVASTVGADLVGITGYDERWQYTERFASAQGVKSNALPDGLDPGSGEVDAEDVHVIVIGQSMDPDLIQAAPSALAGAATGLGYSQDAVVLLTVAQYLRNLGYRAVPSMNDTSLAIPYAIAAGLGEYGRHGLLITPEFGPRLRIGRIYTDLPLEHDAPIRFGVEEMCNECDRCSVACPAKAIPLGMPTTRRHNESNIAGVRKWTIDGEACFGYWAKINSDCAVCVRVCPFTRDYSIRRNRWWRSLAGTRFRRLALNLHDRSGQATRLKSRDWWDSRASAGDRPT